MKLLFAVAAMLFLTGCVATTDSAIKKHDAVRSQVDLGDSKGRVLSILLPTQEELSPDASKPPERYMKDGVKVEIYFMRSRLQPDGLTTDDEFTPYVFNDGKLVGIGWQILGGASTQGQTITDVHVNTDVIVY